MARKYDLISELYRRTAHAVVSDVQNWQAFLRCACRNYRLRFDEQLLIYAQRPDATAVLEIERWNDKFGRWVNRGAKGIAVFEDADRSRQRLTHYFDISDTHAGCDQGWQELSDFQMFGTFMITQADAKAYMYAISPLRRVHRFRDIQVNLYI